MIAFDRKITFKLLIVVFIEQPLVVLEDTQVDQLVVGDIQVDLLVVKVIQAVVEDTHQEEHLRDLATSTFHPQINHLGPQEMVHSVRQMAIDTKPGSIHGIM